MFFAAALLLPTPILGDISNLHCKVLLREGDTIDLTGGFDQAAGTIRFRSEDPRLPLGDKPIALRFSKISSTVDGSVAFGKNWLNFDIHPRMDRLTNIARIEFHLESTPPMEGLVEVNSLYGVAICNIKHLDTQP